MKAVVSYVAAPILFHRFSYTLVRHCLEAPENRIKPVAFSCGLTCGTYAGNYGLLSIKDYVVYFNI